jgi:hypothetical protein
MEKESFSLRAWRLGAMQIKDRPKSISRKDAKGARREIL